MPYRMDRAWFAFVLLTLTGSSVLAQQSATTANTGTLTCTTSEATENVVADVRLSCAFEGNSGLTGSFTGYVDRKGFADVPSGKRVLIWKVSAKEGEFSLNDIAGTYEGMTGAQVAGTLNKVGKIEIVLEPPGETNQLGAVPSPTILHLRLEPTRA